MSKDDELMKLPIDALDTMRSDAKRAFYGDAAGRPMLDITTKILRRQEQSRVFRNQVRPFRLVIFDDTEQFPADDQIRKFRSMVTNNGQPLTCIQCGAKCGPNGELPPCGH